LERASEKLSNRLVTIDQIEVEIKRIDLAKKLSNLVDELEASVTGVKKKDKFVIELADALDDNAWVDELFGRKRLKVEDFPTKKMRNKDE
jgi:hypothetical protein